MIFGWMGDNLSRFRRDFRIAGVRNNEKGNYILPDMPNEPEGYPGKKQLKKFNPKIKDLALRVPCAQMRAHLEAKKKMKKSSLNWPTLTLMMMVFSSFTKPSISPETLDRRKIEDTAHSIRPGLLPCSNLKILWVKIPFRIPKFTFFRLSSASEHVPKDDGHSSCWKSLGDWARRKSGNIPSIFLWNPVSGTRRYSRIRVHFWSPNYPDLQAIWRVRRRRMPRRFCLALIINLWQIKMLILL